MYKRIVFMPLGMVISVITNGLKLYKCRTWLPESEIAKEVSTCYLGLTEDALQRSPQRIYTT